MHHLTLRVAWHDSKWNGTICRAPSENAFCVALDRIREERKDAREDELAGRHWSGLGKGDLPPCVAESGGFMSDREWKRTFRHPYQHAQNAADTHGHLRPTTFEMPPYGVYAVPYAWMLKENQEKIQDSLTRHLPPDEEAPFPTPWVFGRGRQEELLNEFFDRLTPDHSLVFFYTKEGHPLGDNIPRLVVGLGRIMSVSGLLRYDSDKAITYPLWERRIRHSARLDGDDGFLLPYHDYLEPTGDPAEDARRRDLLSEITVPADLAHIRDFSYAAELTNPDIALSTLVRCMEAIRRVQAHGIAEGPWKQREDWLNTQIARAWEDRGAFPGLGAALEAVGMRLGTALTLELMASGAIGPEENPWPLVDAILRGQERPPQRAYAGDLEAVRRTWARLPEERRDLLQLLSRFSLTPEQAKRWFVQERRAKATRQPVQDSEILENPYRIAEMDMGTFGESPISLGIVDRGLLPDSKIAARYPVPVPSAVASINDWRRIRAGLVAVLREAADRGDSLLSITEALEQTDKLRLRSPFEISADWVEAHEDVLHGTIERLGVIIDPEEEKEIAALQLSELKGREERLSKILRARAGKSLSSLGESWGELVKEAIRETGGKFDPNEERHILALEEQVEALEQVTTRKLSALVGRAGTGKTSVLGALLKCEPLANDGVLLLAPTGKARVRLSGATNAEAMTIAQFLYRLGRYDGERQRPLVGGGEKYRQEKTVVIDECSMLTMDDLSAVLDALDLAHVQRLILVGDPNQLPPIGVGRPFADFAALLEQNQQSDGAGDQDPGGALARLTVEVRTTLGAPSDTLRLASWFTREQQPVDADLVFSDLELGEEFNDLEICFWETPDELREQLLEQFQKHLGLENKEDVAGFNRALGFDEEKQWLPLDKPAGVENFQVLSPVRMRPYGVHEINRWVQKRFRKKELDRARGPGGISFGDEEIILRDKVIQTRNERRGAYHYGNREAERVAIANGEIGVVTSTKRVGKKKRKLMKVLFSGRPQLNLDYWGGDFPHGAGPVQLAYALTVHKAQGSDFQQVFVVLPRNSRLISRELLYTALTRSKKRLVLLVEGTNASFIYDFTKPEQSETARRNTNLFRGVVRERALEIPYADHLIHRTEKGHMVRSKSELVIANMLYRMGIDYEYERPFDGTVDHRRVRPDFTFVDPAGEPILWEHLGMLGRADYRRKWEWKKQWYAKNGYVLGENLFTTEDDERGGLDSAAVRETAEKVEEMV